MTITHTLAYFLATYPPAAAAGAFLSRRAGSDALPTLALVATDRPLTHARQVCAREGCSMSSLDLLHASLA